MSQLETIAQHIAASLLDIEAVALRPQQPFTWTSGLKSPIYCDNRLTMSHPAIRESIADGFAALIQEKFPDAEVVAGTATAGIPHAAWVAQKLGLPMIYIRDKAKGHGKENLIEGTVKPGQKVIVIEDLISTGGSSLKAAIAVKEAGAVALGVLAIFSYQLDKATEAFQAADMPLYTLSNYSTLLEVALEKGKIKQEDMELLRSWRSNPAAFGM
ncbi:orotate phosphoribosyltransferase [Paenibacillus sp. V4I3]|uniref:orotate phosphoribosyltransferase n=1 Tax=unclassified Paenibacillus TaxID=185978 RepID=UPI002785BB1E|nr:MULTISPECIES: orotate phosphoribosyltransferase [unclassified Paenibacillus]MDQ0876822.1 orotate phosphoribosyltransferase [Paenibacillus sp. V4I3]MDQ0887298.1 orotate phosphoribosyltransferase [Paenibacillus sp. V4I9]